jgi:hypothetical protein
MMMPLMLLSGDAELHVGSDDTVDEDEFLAEVPDIIPVCVAGIRVLAELPKAFVRPRSKAAWRSQTPVTRRSVSPASMVDQVGRAIATADGADFESDAARYRRLARAALKPLTRPTEAMVNAAHEAVWFDAFWAINSRADFKKAVRAMIRAAMES